MLTALGSKEAEMKIIGCDLHAAQQTIAMLDRETGEIVEQTLKHEAGAVRKFYATLPAPVLVGLEASGSMGWFLQLLDELSITYRVGHPATIRKAETRKQKHDRRDAALLPQLLSENRFPAIWMPSTELRDLRALLLHRHQWVRLRTRVQHALHAIVLGYGGQRGHALWNRDGQAMLAILPLPPHAAHRRDELQALYQQLDEQVDRLDDRVKPPRSDLAPPSSRHIPASVTSPRWRPRCSWATCYASQDARRTEN
jgi:transposase